MDKDVVHALSGGGRGGDVAKCVCVGAEDVDRVGHADVGGGEVRVAVAVHSVVEDSTALHAARSDARGRDESAVVYKNRALTN